MRTACRSKRCKQSAASRRPHSRHCNTWLGPPAKHCDSMVPPYPACDLPLEVKLTSPLEVGGTVFLDGISLKPL